MAQRSIWINQDVKPGVAAFGVKGDFHEHRRPLARSNDLICSSWPSAQSQGQLPYAQKASDCNARPQDVHSKHVPDCHKQGLGYRVLGVWVLHPAGIP